MKKPRTSVILPAFHSESTIEAAIASVLAQSDTDLELLVVEDGSADNTSQVIRALVESRSDSRLRVFYLNENQGVSAARNRAMDAASGEFVAFIDSDDTWEPEFLQKMHAALDGADAAICGRNVLLSDGTKRTSHSKSLGVLTGESAALAMMTDRISPFLWDKVIRRSLFGVSRFPLEVHRFEDQMLTITALSRATRVVSIPDPLVNYRVGSQSLTWGRAPHPRETKAALSFLEGELGSWLLAPHRQKSFDTCATVCYMMTAQSAMRAADEHAARKSLNVCRQSISTSMIVHAIGKNPVIGVGATLLKVAPGIYRYLFKRYLRRQYVLEEGRSVSE